MLNVTLKLPTDLAAQMEAIAASDGKTLDEVYRYAVERFLGHRHLRDLVEFGRAQSGRLGLTEEDVPRLIRESRQEVRDRWP